MKTILFRNSTTRPALRAAAMALSLLVMQDAAAEDAGGAYHMMVIENLAQGKLVTGGKFIEAIQRLEHAKPRRGQFAEHNNLCVAYTKARQLDKAAGACDAAVGAYSKLSASTYLYAGAEHRLKARDKAIALSNRGVLRAVTGDTDGARDDFEASLGLSTELPDTYSNLDRLATTASDFEITAQHAR